MAQVHIILEMENEDYNNEDFSMEIMKAIPYITSVEITDVYLDKEESEEE